MSVESFIEAGKMLRDLEAKYPGFHKLTRDQRSQFMLRGVGSFEGVGEERKPDTAPAMLTGDQGQPRKLTYQPAAEFKALGLTRSSTKSKNIFAKLKGLPRRPSERKAPPEPRPDPMEALRASVRRSTGLAAQASFFKKPGAIEENYRTDPYRLIRKETRGTRQVYVCPDGATFPSGQAAEDYIESTMNLEARPPRRIM